MGLFEDVRRIVAGKKKPASTDIAAALASAEERRAALIRRRDELEAGRLDAVVAGDGERTARRLEVADLLDELLDVNAITDALQQRLVEAQRAEVQAELRRVYVAAKAARDAVVGRTRSEYLSAAKTIASLIEANARAQILVDEANRSLPDGAEPLESAEAVARYSEGLSQRIASESVVELWSPEGVEPPRPVPDALAARIELEPGGRRGFIASSVTTTASHFDPHLDVVHYNGPMRATHRYVHYYVKRKFVRREILDAVPGSMPEELQRINLPGLDGADVPIWTPEPFISLSPEGVIEKLSWLEDQRRQKPTVPDRTRRVEFEPAADKMKEASE